MLRKSDAVAGATGSLLTLALLSAFGFWRSTQPLDNNYRELVWSDGNRDRRGSCVCGDSDAYCLWCASPRPSVGPGCLIRPNWSPPSTPSLAVDLVIEVEDDNGVCVDATLRDMLTMGHAGIRGVPRTAQ
jgi:hypothetical protein